MPSADRRNPTGSLSDARRWLDGVLVASMAAAAAVLGCQELFDGDVWWHLRAGQWILANGRLPSLDPFTFASAVTDIGSTSTGRSRSSWRWPIAWAGSGGCSF